MEAEEEKLSTATRSLFLILSVMGTKLRNHIPFSLRIIPSLRASPLSLHLHPHFCFYIRNADANLGKSRTYVDKYQTMMKIYARSLELRACVTNMYCEDLTEV